MKLLKTIKVTGKGQIEQKNKNVLVYQSTEPDGDKSISRSASSASNHSDSPQETSPVVRKQTAAVSPWLVDDIVEEKQQQEVEKPIKITKTVVITEIW